MKEKLLKIINHYGINHQQRKLSEEVFELQEAIHNIECFDNLYPEDLRKSTLKNNRNAFDKHIAEEIADCYVLLEQFRLAYGISREDIKKNMTYKVDRQLERIKLDKTTEQICKDEFRKAIHGD